MPDRKRPKPADYFSDWKQREALAEAMIPVVGKLYRERNVKVYVYGRSLVSQSVLDIMKTHRFVRQVEHNELSEFETWPLVEALGRLELGTGHVDIGRLSVTYAAGPRTEGVSAEAFLRKELQGLIGSTAKPVAAPRDVVLYGFGRIGRLMARLLIEKTGGGDVLRLRAVVVRKSSQDDLVKRAALLRRDSIHGSFDGTIRVDEENGSFIANGNEVKLIYADAPESIDYTAYGINNALVIDNTGAFTKRADLERHLKAKGVSKVLLTAPGKEIPNVVYGINHKDLDIDNEKIFSAASCTTNAICPVLKVVEDNLGIEKGHIETVHAYTNDQNLLDNYHKGPRRGRSAAINMVITSTGAGTAVAKAIPSLKDKLTANAVRVPTPNGSLAIMNLTLKKPVADLAAMNDLIRRAALNGDLVNQIHYQVDPELVSSDIIGDTCCSVFDSNATIVAPDGRTVVLYAWYDNEFGYTKQVIRLAKHISKVQRLIYY